MRKLLGALILLAGCPEPPKTASMAQAVEGLRDLHSWDPATEARGQYAYDAVVNWGPEILPALVGHLTDLTPTAIYEEKFGITVTVSDVCFVLLLKLMGRRWEEFEEDGVFVHTVLPNPIFSIRWKDRESRARVQARFARLLPPP
jgi:hypothetical protein